MAVSRFMGVRGTRVLVLGLLFLGFVPKLPAPNFTWDSGPYWPAPRDSSGLALLPNGDLLLYAGRGSAGGLKDTYRFDLGSDAWYPAATEASGPGSRYGHAMAFDPSLGEVVMFGGVDAGVPVAETWVFASGAWQQEPAVGPAARFGHAMSHHGSLNSGGNIVLFGGFDVGNRYGDTWSWDGTARAWIPRASVGPSPRFSSSMTFDATVRNQVVLFGGNDAGGLRNDTWLLDADANWLPGPQPHVNLRPKDRHRMANLPGKGVVLFGGFDVANSKEVWILDAAGWAPDPVGVPARLVARVNPELVQSGNNLYLFGGAGPGVLDDMWQYDGNAWVELSASRPSGREGAKASWDGTQVTLFGGQEPGPLGAFPTDTWQFDGSAWAPLPTVTSPPGRRDHGLAFDGNRGVLVLFGGDDGSPAGLNDTWELQAGDWGLGPAAPPGLTPRSRFGTTFIEDPASLTVAIFGGRDSFGLTAQLWKYDGAAWNLSPFTGPSPREGAGLAYDAIRNIAVLFGGFDLVGAPLNDTWELSSTGWVPGATAPFAARGEMAFVYHRQAQQVFLLGGSNGAGAVYGDAWGYTGGWSQAPVPPVDLTPRYTIAVGYDFTNNRAVLAGGETPSVESSVFQFGYSLRDVVGGQGLGQPNPNRVRAFDETGAATPVDFYAYAAGSWGVNVEAADLSADELDEILTAPGPGPVHGPQIRAFDSVGTPQAKVNFFAYGTLKFGANVGATSIEADPEDEILSGAGPGEVFGPHVRGFAYNGTVQPISKVNFYAYFTLRYGVNVAGGDIDGDAFDEIVTSPGPGVIFGPQVRGFAYNGFGPLTPLSKVNFNAFPVLQYGARTAVGIVTGDSSYEIVASPGPGPSSSFPARFAGFNFDGTAVNPIAGYDITPFPGLTYGGRPALANVGGFDPADELFAVPGPDPTAPAQLKAYLWDGVGLVATPLDFVLYSGGYGVAAVGGALGY